MTDTAMPSIDAIRWARLKDHVADLSAMEPSARAGALAALPLDPTDRGWVERLLAPLLTGDARLLTSHPSARANADEGSLRCRPGDMVGRYRIEGLLGRGGMGEVYGAALDDGQVVALKVLRSGLAESDYARFSENEQRALRRLDDPRIAKFIEAFVAPDVGACLVIEWVDGEPLQAYCRSRRFSVEARLRLFIDVCQAVASAHRQLIVHRDLKPTNVLVTPDGQVKLLDFGVSKLLDEDVSHTQTYGNLFTLDYAAPEQVLHEPVSAATDIYALGVLLYRLLTDVPPYELGEGGSLVKAILNDPPQQISAGIQRARATGHMPPAAHVDRDLDRVVARAMEKVQRDRYGSALELAADVQAILDGRAISGGGGAFYRMRKFSRRYRAAVAAASVATIALIAGTAISVQFARHAGQQAHRAKIANRFLLTALDLTDRFSGNNRGDFTLVEVLEHAVERAHTDLQNEPDVQADVLVQLSYALQNRGKLAAALSAAREAHAIRAASRDDNSVARATAAQRLASVEIESGHLDDAKLHLDETLQQLSESESDDSVRIQAYSSLGKLSSMRGDAVASLAWYQKIPPLRRALGGDHAPDLAMDFQNVGTGLYNLSRYREADKAYAQAIELLHQQLGESHPRLGFVQYSRTTVLIQLGRFEEASALLAQTESSLGGGGVVDAPGSVSTERLRALLDFYSSDYASALRRLGPVLPHLRTSSPMSVAATLTLRGRIELAGGDARAAAATFAESEQMSIANGRAEHPQRWYASGFGGVARAAAGELAEGEAQLDEAIAHLARTSLRAGAEQAELSLYSGAAARRRGDVATALVLHRSADKTQRELDWLGDLGSARVDAELAQDGLMSGADDEARAAAGSRLAHSIAVIQQIAPQDPGLGVLLALQRSKALE